MESKIVKMEVISDTKCKHCKYLLRIRPKKRIMHKCAVDNADITLSTKACNNFEL